jgi:predicted MFS family arabinose efflux permease
MALTFFGTGLSNLVTGRIAERWGPVRAVVYIRLVGVAFLLGMVVMPTFWAAGGFYVLRSLLNRGSVGARQAVSVSLTRAERRGLASSLNQVSMRLPGAVGPTVAGYLMEGGDLVTPFILAAGLQLLYAVTYGYYFRDLDRTLAEGAGTHAPGSAAAHHTPPR